MPLPVRPMQAVSLQILLSQEGSWYPSLVLDFTGDRELVVGVPMNRGSEVEVAPGTQVAVEIASPDGLRRYTAVVRGRGSSPPSSISPGPRARSASSGATACAWKPSSGWSWPCSAWAAFRARGWPG